MADLKKIILLITDILAIFGESRTYWALETT